MKLVSVMTTDASGGAEFAAVEMLDALSESGHETVMLTDQTEIVRDTRVIARPISIGSKLSTATYARLLLRWPMLVRRLRRALEREWPYDVLVVHYKKEQLLARHLPGRLRATLVWAEWGPVPFPLRRGLPRRLYLAAGARAAGVMAVSAGTRASVCAVGVPPEKVVVVPNVMRTEEIGFTEEGRRRTRERLEIPHEAFVVGCISRFHPKKRNDVVIEAAIRLGRDDVHLILGGAGETEEELRALAAPLAQRAHFIPTPREEIADVLSAFDVLVFCPSPTEGAPRAVILGMLAQRPCLSSGAEGVADMIEPDFGGIASPENDPAALCALIRPYMEDPSRVEREGVLARRRAEEVYAAARVAALIEDLLAGWGASGFSGSRQPRPETRPTAARGRPDA
jgi:glycosyltransferase involved in cell wall biosynthesis